VQLSGYVRSLFTPLFDAKIPFPIELRRVRLMLTAKGRPEDVVHRFSWFSAMVTQRSIKPYVMPRDPVEGTVPVTGPTCVVLSGWPQMSKNCGSTPHSPAARSSACSYDRERLNFRV